MAPSVKKENTTEVRHLYKTAEEKYKCCGLLNIIQHIDIYGRRRSIVNEHKPRIYRPNPVTMSSISLTSTKGLELKREPSEASASMKNIDNKLNRFSVTTKVVGLYPGHDMLSKRVRRSRLDQLHKTSVTANFKSKR